MENKIDSIVFYIDNMDGVIDKNKLPSKADDENTDETEYLGVRYTELIPVLIKAIQELKAQNDDLQSQINELKAQ